MTHLYIIRHGEALSVVQNTIENTRLSPLGIKQAEHLRDRLAATGEIKADVLIASTMLRARHTAEIIAPALGLPIIFDEGIEEWRNGEADHMDIEEHRACFEAVPFEEKPFFRVDPTAESWAEFMLRVGTALHRITTEHEGKTIVLACHGGIVDASFLLFQGLSTLQIPQARFNTHNTSITYWRKRSWADLPVSWVLESYNDVMHLRDIDAPVRIPWQDIATQPIEGQEESVVPTEAEE